MPPKTIKGDPRSLVDIRKLFANFLVLVMPVNYVSINSIADMPATSEI